MLKLYKNNDGVLQYWETWQNGVSHTIHWGTVGEKGDSREIRSGIFSGAKKIIQKEIAARREEGYAEIQENDLEKLVVEYTIDGQGTESDIEKRIALENRLRETLGWTGLGDCDGGSMGTGTMEIFCPVVSFEIGKRVIENNLKDTEFSDYSRIYVFK